MDNQPENPMRLSTYRMTPLMGLCAPAAIQRPIISFTSMRANIDSIKARNVMISSNVRRYLKTTEIVYGDTDN